MTGKFIFECSSCGKLFDPGAADYLCPGCRGREKPGEPPLGVLKTLYDYEKLKKKCGKDLFGELKAKGYLDLLPINDTDSLSGLRVGNTPLYRINSLTAGELPFVLYLKDDSQNPTFSYKDRASNLVSAVAREKGIKTIIAASTGNAGSSLAGICASQSQQAVILAPRTAPIAKLTQILVYGAALIPVEGSYDDAFDLSVEATGEFGWYNRNTAFNPFTIEGKKTASYEIFDQLDRKVPDRIFVPVGDGVIISGIYKGWEDLLKLGIIERIPEIVAVQSSASNNLVRNLNRSNFESQPSKTIADSISVDIPRNFRMTSKYIEHYCGVGIEVSDNDILNASLLLGRETGIFAEPAAASALAGMLKLRKEGRLEPGSVNVVLLTGSGLKDPDAVRQGLDLPRAIKPDLAALKASNQIKRLRK